MLCEIAGSASQTRWLVSLPHVFLFQPIPWLLSAEIFAALCEFATLRRHLSLHRLRPQRVPQSSAASFPDTFDPASLFLFLSCLLCTQHGQHGALPLQQSKHGKSLGKINERGQQRKTRQGPGTAAGGREKRGPRRALRSARPAARALRHNWRHDWAVPQAGAGTVRYGRDGHTTVRQARWMRANSWEHGTVEGRRESTA